MGGADESFVVRRGHSSCWSGGSMDEPSGEAEHRRRREAVRVGRLRALAEGQGCSDGEESFVRRRCRGLFAFIGPSSRLADTRGSTPTCTGRAWCPDRSYL